MPRGTAPYPPEFRAEVVRLARQPGHSTREVARDLGIGNETLRRWVIQAEVDAGETEDLTSDEWAELVMLWRQRGHPAERRSHQTSRSCGPYPAQDHPLP